MKKRRLRFPAKPILIGILLTAGLITLAFFSYRFLTTSDYFKVNDSEYFSGQNIFKVDLRTEAQRLSRMYPDYKRIVFRRLLPDRIVADFIPRRAVAKVRLSDDFYVDEEGFLFSASGQQEDNSQLPLIYGLDVRRPYPRPGTKYNERSLQETLEFIDNLNKDRNLADYIKIKEIDLSNINDVILFSSTGCKINLGGIGSLGRDLSILKRLFAEVKPDLATVEYIDLRFREPVIKYK